MKTASLLFLLILTTFSTQAQCPAVNVPYVEDFESTVAPDLPACITLENAGLGNDWMLIEDDSYGNGLTGQYMRYEWNSDEDANAWFFTRGINMVANTTYRISYDYASGDPDGFYEESMKVAYGTGATAADMTTILADYPTIYEGITTESLTFTPTVSGVYYFGFNAYSLADMFVLNVDNIKIKAVAAPVITNFTPASSCSQTTLLTINGTSLENATVTVGGTAITLATNTDAQITATISAAMTGAIVVTTPDGTTTSATNFTFTLSPALTLNNTSTLICEGSSSSATTIATGAASYTTYTWTPSTGVTGNSTSGWIFNPTAETSYVLNASNTTTGCVNSVNYDVEITRVPTAVTATSATVEVCQNATSAVAGATGTLAVVAGTRTVSFGTNIELPGGDYNEDFDFINGTASRNATVHLPTGAVVTSTKLVFTNVTTSMDTYVSELEASLSGAVTLASTMVAEVDEEVANAGPYEIITDNIANAGGAVTLNLVNTYEGLSTFGDISLVIEYTVPGTLNMTWWNAPTAGTQIGTGATLETVGTSVLPTTATPGTYTVYAQASNGVCARTERKAIAVVVKANPTPVITAPSLVICDGSSVVLTSSATAGNVWSTTATSNTITVSTAGSYTVTVTTNGCTGTSAPAVVTTAVAPVANATLTGNITITATPAGQNYQWINCATSAPVAGATSAIFTAPANGSYKVIVTNAGGCKDTSACVNVSKVGLAENSVDLGISLYPNPTEGNVYVAMTETEAAAVTVYDALGKVVLTMNNIHNGTVIDMNNNQKGIYLVKVSNAKGTNVFRIVKK